MAGDKERGNIILLVILYTLQGIPMGLSASIPFLLQDKISYSQQAVFSLVSLPFSLKLLWAPIVDSMYIKSFGRRKSWLVPVQIISGFLMIWGGDPRRINEWVGEGDFKPCVYTLSIYFTILYVLMATQDIAVDGWALTMLSKENKGHASTCNSVGQTLGYFVAHVGFLVLNDAHSCNAYLRYIPSDTGLVTLAGFIHFWGWAMIAVTFFVWMFKSEVEPTGGKRKVAPRSLSNLPIEFYSGEESPVNFDIVKCAVSNRPKKNENADDCKAKETVENEEICVDSPEGIIDSYKQLWSLFWLRPVQLIIFILLTCRIPFAATDASTHFKIIESGMSKEQLAFFAPLLMPIGIISPILVGRLTAGPTPLRVFSVGMLVRMLLCVAWTGVLPLTVYAYREKNPPFAYFASVFLVTALYNLSTDFMFVSQMSFFAKISDPTIGGTYMTLLNTITNLGNKWPHTVSLWMLDYVTIKDCSKGDVSCRVILDGYYIEVGVCLFIGVFWILFCRNYLHKLEQMDESEWHVVDKSK